MPEKEDNNVLRTWLQVTTIQVVTTLTVHSSKRDIVQLLVSEQDLYHADVHLVLQQVRRKTMTPMPMSA
jgi:hypothetical protein